MQTRKDVFNFRGAVAPPLTASRQGIWAKADTSAAGSPTIQTGSDGSLQMTLDNTNEVQNICTYFGDVLCYPIGDLIRMEIIAALTASFPAACTAVLGLGSARNDTPDSVTANAWFRIEGGSQAVFCETDDNVNDVDDKATGLTLSTSFKRFAIDFSAGLVAYGPPNRSKGGKGAVQFWMGDANGNLRRVCEGTHFNMENYSSNLQPIFQLQKTAAASVATLSILECSFEYRLPSSVR